MNNEAFSSVTGLVVSGEIDVCFDLLPGLAGIFAFPDPPVWIVGKVGDPAGLVNGIRIIVRDGDSLDTKSARGGEVALQKVQELPRSLLR